MSLHNIPKRSIFDARYLTRANIEKKLATHLSQAMNQVQAHPIVLDLGSGTRIYEPLVEGATYLALDITVQNSPDVVGVGEDLPFADASIDIIINIQVLEHVEDPGRVLREISRVLKPNGKVLLTTHGTMFYHPSPDDYWRWTQAGLVKIFRENGEFSDIDLQTVNGSFRTLGFFLAFYTTILFRKLACRLSILGFIAHGARLLFVAMINLITIFVDRLVPEMNDWTKPITLIGVFLVVATKR